MRSSLSLLMICVCWSGVLIAQTSRDWITPYENSGYLETPRYAETMDYCRRLAEASPWIKLTDFGVSPERRKLPLVILDKSGQFTPDPLSERDKPVVLIQNCIHAGESDGKDASLMLMREIAVTRALEDLLDHATLLIIPIFNVDGHERFGPYNRANQNGPKEMGFRSTAQNLNLNRDYLKAETPEMQAWLKMFNTWRPDFMVDNHVTDGADYQYPLTYGLDVSALVAPPLQQWTGKTLEPFIQQQMAKDGLPVFPYFRLKKRPYIHRGILAFPFSPRYSTGYGVAQNRVFLLVEDHALKDYRTRVTANYQLMIHLLKLINRERRRLLEVNRQADQATSEIAPGTVVPLKVDVDRQDSTMVDFLGVEYKQRYSEISDGPWSEYTGRPKTIRLAHYNKTIPVDSARAPYAYLLGRQWQEQISTLERHGVKVRYLSRPLRVAVESYRFKNPQWAKRPFEGRLRVDFELAPIQEERNYPAGSAVVLLNQRTNRLIMQLLEPHAPDSFLRWGYWNTIFERKEYAEDYFLEQTARQLLQENPALRRKFEAALKANPGMAKNRWARLYFFYARTPYWEDRVNVYPVGKLMTPMSLPLTESDQS